MSGRDGGTIALVPLVLVSLIPWSRPRSLGGMRQRPHAHPNETRYGRRFGSHFYIHRIASATLVVKPVSILVLWRTQLTDSLRVRASSCDSLVSEPFCEFQATPRVSLRNDLPPIARRYGYYLKVRVTPRWSPRNRGLEWSQRFLLMCSTDLFLRGSAAYGPRLSLGRPVCAGPSI